jgi:Dolichyl-phosphate-mannose-protein mannosyltransferase
VSVTVSRNGGALPLRERLRAFEDRSWLWPVLLALGAALVGLVIVRYAFTFWNHTLDDDVYRLTGRQTYADFPAGLWQSTADDRGLQRLQAWLLGFGPGLFGTPGGFRVVRVVDILVYLTTVIPIWRWVRALGVGRWIALLAAVLAILTPWAIVTSTFMTESLAYPLAVWGLYTGWQAASEPTLGRLVKAGLVVVVAALARSVLVLIVPIFLLAMLAVGARNARRAWATRATWTRRQVLPWALVGAGLLFVLALYFGARSVLNPLTGVYGSTFSVNLEALRLLVRQDAAYVVSGVGILPGVIAAGFVARSLVRPARDESLALAVMTLGVAVFVAYSTMRAGPDERYIMYLAPMVIVCAAVGVGRREVGPLALAFGTLFTIWLFSGVDWRTTAQSFDYYVYAADVFHGKVMLLNVGERLRGTGLGHATIVALGIVVSAGVTALALWGRGRPARVAAGALVVGLLVLGVAQLSYVDRKFTAQANFGPRDLGPHAWVDNAVGKDGRVGVFVTRTGDDITGPQLYDTWREIAFFSQVDRVVYQISGSVALNPMYGDQDLIAIDEQTGHLKPSRVPVPREMLEMTLNPKAPLAGRVIAEPEAGFVPWRLVRLDGTPRVRWLITGSDDASWTVPTQPTSIRVYRAGGAGACLTLGFGPPIHMQGPRRITVKVGKKTYKSTLNPDSNVVMHGIRLTGGDADAFAPVVVSADGTTMYQNAPRGVRLLSVTREGC